MLIGLLSNLAWGAPYAIAGIEIRPLSRGDLTWVLDGNTSGTGAGALDGFTKPNLQAYGGVNWRRLSVITSLGIAGFQTTTQADDVTNTRGYWAVRPAVDTRLWWLKQQRRRPGAYAIIGIHAGIPIVENSSSGFTPEEQAVANELAANDQARLGSFGARAGVGAMVQLHPAIAAGAQYTLDVQRSWWVPEEPGASVVLTGDATFFVELRWGDGSRDGAD